MWCVNLRWINSTNSDATKGRLTRAMVKTKDLEEELRKSMNQMRKEENILE